MTAMTILIKKRRSAAATVLVDVFSQKVTERQNNHRGSRREEKIGSIRISASGTMAFFDEFRRTGGLLEVFLLFVSSRLVVPRVWNEGAPPGRAIKNI